MAGPDWPPSRFWQYWALAGMLVLTAAFWWGVEGYARFESGVGDAIADGLLRFSLLILTPALLIVWAAAAWFRRRIGEGGYWQFLGLVALIWAGAVAVSSPALEFSMAARLVLAIGLLAVGAAGIGVGWHRWMRTEIAVRTGGQPPGFTGGLVFLVAIGGLLSAALIISIVGHR